MSKGFNIDSIGIEFEFSLDYHVDIVYNLIQDMVDEKNKENEKFKIELDREYYQDQVELKLRRTADMKEGVEYFKSFLLELYELIPGIHATTKNHFVGTHIHMFINKDGEPYTNFAQGKKIALVNKAYGIVSNFITKWESFGIKERVAKDEMSRLTRNHNILRYFDGGIGDRLRENLERKGFTYQQFHNGTDKPKYTPVLWSLPNTTTGKPHSLEIRCIPNTFFLTQDFKEINSLIEGVEEVLNRKGEIDNDKETEEIVASHKSMVELLYALS